IAKIRSKETTAEEQKNLAQEYDDLVSQHRALTKDIQEQDREKITAIKSKLATETRILLDEITKVTNAYAKEKGYTWVIETSGVSNTQISPLVYAKGTIDITEEVLAILNKDAPKKDDTPAEETSDEAGE
ncbi:MAG: OmpH family outer membrane protein, partial [Akkermansiaceae bacterium]